MKKVLSAVLTAALLVSTVPAAFAASDIDGHWAKSYITELHENGIINPSASTGNYGPDDKVTRWEFMRYINRAFGFTEKADKLNKALHICTEVDKKYVITGHEDGATCSQFGDYLMATIEQLSEISVIAYA